MRDQPTEKPLHWVGSSKKDLLTLPADVVDDFGYALGAVQLGGHAATSQSLERRRLGSVGIGGKPSGRHVPGRLHNTFAKAVYVLHCFQKKSPSGIRTAQSDIDLIHQRLKLAEQHYKEHHEHQN